MAAVIQNLQQQNKKVNEIFRNFNDKYGVKLSDEDLREFGFEPEDVLMSRSFSDEFDEIMKSDPNIVERTASDAFLAELEAELEAQEKQNGNQSQTESEDDFEIIENTNIPSIENKKPKKRFGIFGGNKPLAERTTKELLLILFKKVTRRNYLTIQLNLFNERKQKVMNEMRDKSIELKKRRLLSILRAWMNVNNGQKPSDYSQEIESLNKNINNLKKYLNEKRGVSKDAIESVEDGWEIIDDEETREARQQPSTPSKPKKKGWFGGNPKKGKKSKHKKTQRKSKQNKKKHTKKHTKKQRKRQNKKGKTKKSKK